MKIYTDDELKRVKQRVVTPEEFRALQTKKANDNVVAQIVEAIRSTPPPAPVVNVEPPAVNVEPPVVNVAPPPPAKVDVQTQSVEVLPPPSPSEWVFEVTARDRRTGRIQTVKATPLS